jgi:hypothetical protein
MQIVSTCLLRDLNVYKTTFKSLRKHIPGAELHVITRRQDFPRFSEACGADLQLWDESTLLATMTMEELKQVPLPFFPRGAGWYFQQFLKLAFVDVSNDDDYFLIWDADTVLLKALDFFSPDGLPYYTRASENHHPYFETFEKLFGVPANREYSFISQHQLIKKSVLRMMIAEIEERFPDCKSWYWAVMGQLKGEGSNLFSEYETYGHYLKIKQPDSFLTRDIAWTRHGGGLLGYGPDNRRLKKLSRDYTFAAFESTASPMRRIARCAKKLLR